MGGSVLKGTAFELEVGLVLTQLGDIRVMFDVEVYSKSLGARTQIDLVVLTKWGNFCVEAKSYMHELNGSLEDYQWIGKTWSKKTYIINPVVQNTTHTRALTRAIFKTTRQMVHFDSVIVLPNSCTINTDSNLVMNLSQLVRFCMRNEQRAPKVYDNVGLEKIIDKVRRRGENG